MLTYSQVEAEWEVTMYDLPQPLLAHLQREARDTRDQDRASSEENEKQIGASRQKLDKSRTLLQFLERLKYDI
jgi:hypothetical protein